MKPRRVTLDLETENDIPVEQLRKLRSITVWDEKRQRNVGIKVIQAGANVIKEENPCGS